MNITLRDSRITEQVSPSAASCHLIIIIRQFNNIDISSEVSTVHKFVYTDEALLLVR